MEKNLFPGGAECSGNSLETKPTSPCTPSECSIAITMGGWDRPSGGRAIFRAYDLTQVWKSIYLPFSWIKFSPHRTPSKSVPPRFQITLTASIEALSLSLVESYITALGRRRDICTRNVDILTRYRMTKFLSKLNIS